MTRTKAASRSFRDFYNDDDNVSPAERAKIEFEVELIGKLVEAREAKGLGDAGDTTEWHGNKDNELRHIE